MGTRCSGGLMVPTICVQWRPNGASRLRGEPAGAAYNGGRLATTSCVHGAATRGGPVVARSALKPQIPPAHGSFLPGNGDLLRRRVLGRRYWGSYCVAGAGGIVLRGVKAVPDRAGRPRGKPLCRVVGRGFERWVASSRRRSGGSWLEEATATESQPAARHARRTGAVASVPEMYEDIVGTSTPGSADEGAGASLRARSSRYMVMLGYRR